MNIIWPCDLCDSETRSLRYIGIDLKNKILCRSCYENTLEDIKCDGNFHRLCDNMKCKKCFQRSLASSEKVFNLNFSVMIQLGLKYPRFIQKKSGVKYPFICEFNHKWNITLHKLAAGQWCSDAECKKRKIKKTFMERYGVENCSQTEQVKKKFRETCIEKYGVENPMQVEKIKNKNRENQVENCRKTCREKYGVEFTFQYEEIKEKIKKTCLERYGVEIPSQSNEIIKKRKETCLEKYGVENPSQTEEIKEKIRETCLKKYGVENPLKSEEIREKYRKTCLERYGTENFMQSSEFKRQCMEKYGVDHHSKRPEIFAKIQESAFNCKEYVFPSGRKTKVQGYENIVLDFLIRKYREDDIQTSFENRLKIDYYIEDEKHSYFPDIFIPSKNLIIEVKSNYTYNLHKEVNELKAQACIDNGYKFQFYIIDRDKDMDVQTR